MSTFSKEHLEYLKIKRNNKILIIFCQLIIIALFLIIWEVLAKKNIINTFLFSSPSEIFK